MKLFAKQIINKVSIRKEHLQDVDFLFFCVSIFVLPISITLSSKLLLISFALGFLKSLYKKDFKWFYNHKPIILFFCIFFIYIFIQGLVIDGLEKFLKRFDKGYASYLVFLLAPLFFNKRDQIRIVPKALILGLFFLFFQIIISSLIEDQIYDREKVLEIFDLHHLYASLYILFAINYLIKDTTKIKNKKQITSYVLSLIILLSFLVFFKSKAALAILPILLVFHVVSSLKLSTKKYIIIIIFCTLLLYYFKQFLYVFYYKALDFRLQIWIAANNCVVNRPILGYGSLNEYNVLRNQHFLDGNYIYLDSNFNAHNQYLSVLLKFGYLGLIMFISPFLILIKKINKALQREYIGFLLILGAMAFIESLTNRHHGIVFTAIMLYYYNTFKQNEVLESS